MVFLSYLQSDINLVYIRDLKIECRARPLTRRGKEEGFHVEIESIYTTAVHNKCKHILDPLLCYHEMIVSLLACQLKKYYYYSY